VTRVVLVTGGARGIGLAVAQRFAALGDRVAVTYRSADPPDGLFAVKCDVTSSTDVDEAFKAVEEQLGSPIEVLVSNAGMNKDMLLLRMGEDDFTSVIDANLTAAYRVSKRAAQGMLRARRGRIVLVSSVVGLLGSAGQANYAASKAGMVGFARSLARELGSRSITVNVVAPGPVETDMTAALSEQRRKDLVKIAKKSGEECKVAVRKARHEALDLLTELKEGGDASEDEVDRAKKKAEELVSEAGQSIDQIIATKEKEILAI